MSELHNLLATYGREQGFKPLPDDIVRRFESELPGGAMEAAEAWCVERGYSIGPISKGSPRALMHGLHCLPHWSAFAARDRVHLHGAIIARSIKFGPVVVRIRRRAADITLLQAS